MFDIPQIDKKITEHLLKRSETEGQEILYQALKSIDPEAIKTIHPNDVYRTLRALEVYQGTGKRFSEYKKAHQTELPFEIVKIGLNCPRAELHENIMKRTQNMIKNGLVDEVKALKQKYPLSVKPFKSVGYKEALGHLEGQLSHDAMVEKIAQQTRALARRQLTWFRADKEIQWVWRLQDGNDVLTSSLLEKK